MGRFLIGLGLVGMISAIAAHHVAGGVPNAVASRASGLSPSEPLIFALFLAGVLLAMIGAWVGERERRRHIATAAKGPGMWDSRR